MSSHLPVLAEADALAVRQIKEWGEIFTGWETQNRYQVTAPDGRVLLYAGESEDGLWSALLRGFLKNKRPFTIELMDPAGQLVLTLRRPWTWWFARLEIRGSDGRFVGAVQQRFAFFARRYDIQDAAGQVVAELHGPFFQPWTFQIRVGERAVGKITKQWSGFLKEAFSDADNFGVELGPELQGDARALSLAATFLIDFVHFENSE